MSGKLTARYYCSMCGGSYPHGESHSCGYNEAVHLRAENARLKARVAELEAQIAASQPELVKIIDGFDWDDWEDMTGAMV